MPEERLADLDELVLRCKSPQSRQYIAEAVACYRAGAYRSCIVATWIAVVFDYLHKLRELELTGDTQAKAKLTEFEKIRTSSDVTGSLQFEKALLAQMETDFELISPLEHADLQRLLDDRNRCAHPSMNSLEETYHPSAEQARTHLRNAIVYVLQRPPVQGKAALNRLLTAINSDYFPTKTAAAVEQFRHGPLAKPRDVLVRNLALVLIKDLLLKEVAPSRWPAHVAALNALRSLHRDVTEATFKERLSDLIRQVPDTNLAKTVTFLSDVRDTWQFLSPDIADKLREYVRRMPIEDVFPTLNEALQIPELNVGASTRLTSVSATELSELISEYAFPEFCDRAIDFYGESLNFDTANNYAQSLVIPSIPYMTKGQVQRLIQAARDNNQISGSYRFVMVLKELAESNMISEPEYEALQREFKKE